MERNEYGKGYGMVSRGKETVAEALEDMEFMMTEEDFMEGMKLAGFSVP